MTAKTARETRHQRRRREQNERDAAIRQEVLDHVEKLELGDNDCLVLRLADKYFVPPLAMAVERFGQQIGEMTRRPVFLLRMDQKLSAQPVPTARRDVL